jgi:hypothetical protein
MDTQTESAKKGREARAHRRSARALRQRGSALIEGIIAITMITIMFAGVRFFHVLHDRKGDTLREARYRAWVATRPGCSKPIHGQDSRNVSVPTPIRTGSLEQGALTVQSSVDMPCNEEPHPNDDLLSVLEWATSNGKDAILAPAAEAVMGFFKF